MGEPWLSGLIVCALHVEAEAVREALKERGLRTRSVPAGRAKEAWTCATDRGTLAVVTGGKGAKAAAEAAGFWMPRARTLVLAGAGPGTGLVEAGAVVLEGDDELAVLGARAAHSPNGAKRAKVATVEEPVRSEPARQTLQNAGYAAWAPHVDMWRAAVAQVGGVMLICHGITPAHEGGEALMDTLPEGAITAPWWQTAAAWLQPSKRAKRSQAQREHQTAAASAARCAVAALLGPPA